MAYGNRPSTQLRLGCCYGVFHKRIIKTSFYPETSFFCQLEGCSAVSKKFSLREANSFAFTLTENDSGKVVMEFVLMCFDLVRALFTRKKRLQRKNSNCAAAVST